MNRLAQEAVTQIGGFKAAEITMLTWAYAVTWQGLSLTTLRDIEIFKIRMLGIVGIVFFG